VTPEAKRELQASEPANQPALDPTGYRELPAMHEFNVDINDVLSFNVGGYLATLFEASDSIANQIEAGILAHISDIATAAGNVISVKDRDIADAYLDTLEDMTFRFNDNGEPNVTLVMHPEQVKKLKGVEMTPEQKARYDAIVTRKREEWNASQRRRELPGLGN
jgi:hypothetical protein